MTYTYLLVNFFTVLVPFIFSFHSRLCFHKNFIHFLKANLFAAALFLVWDALFTYWGVWGFNDNYILGFRIVQLPLEEILFFVCIPFACLFTYHCSYVFKQWKWSKRLEPIAVVLASLIMLVAGIWNFHQAYTASTFISLSIFLLLLEFVFKVTWLPQIISIYPLLLIPFFIVNGILTGTGLEQPVVWYNNNENLGIRLGTIPVEDIFYGLELILLNLFFYHRLKPMIPSQELTKGK